MVTIARKIIISGSILFGFRLLAGFGLWLWATPTEQVTTPPAENTPA